MKKMTKSTKIILCVIAATLLLCAVIIGVSVGINHKKEPETTPLSQTQSSQENTSSYFDIDSTEPSQSDANDKTSLQSAILGKWTDSAGMSGYEFFENGKVTVTYFNLTVPILNLPLSGTADGTYTLDGEMLAVSYSIYSKAINYHFYVSFDESNTNQLKLTNQEDGKTSVYMRGAPSMASEIPESGKVDDELTGTWGSADATIRYQFDGNGIVTMAFAKAELPEASRKEISGSYTGVYVTEGDKLTIQFLLDGERATQSYSYSASTKTLSLVDNKGNTILFLRDGIGALPEGTTREEDLLGKWRDSTGSRGYRFMDGGLVEITYVDINIPVVNIPINGSFRGTYDIDGDTLVLRYSAYTRTVTERFSFSVSGNALTLTNLDSGAETTYTRA